MITNMTQCINNLLMDFIMADQLIPRREMQFQLYEVLNTQSLCEKARFEEHNVETFNAVIDMAEKMAEELFLPHNAIADKDEPTFDGKKVTMIGEVKKVSTDLDGAALVICATDDRSTNADIASQAQQRGLPVNVVLIAHDHVVIEPDDHVILFLIDKRRTRDVEKLFQVGFTFF